MSIVKMSPHKDRNIRAHTVERVCTTVVWTMYKKCIRSVCEVIPRHSNPLMWTLWPDMEANCELSSHYYNTLAFFLINISSLVLLTCPTAPPNSQNVLWEYKSKMQGRKTHVQTCKYMIKMTSNTMKNPYCLLEVYKMNYVKVQEKGYKIKM